MRRSMLLYCLIGTFTVTTCAVPAAAYSLHSSSWPQANKGDPVTVTYSYSNLLNGGLLDKNDVPLMPAFLKNAVDEAWSLISFHVESGTGEKPHVRLTLRHGDRDYTEQLTAGDGPIDAAFLTTEKITGLKLICKDFRVRAATLGRDAQGEVTMDVEYEGQVFRGRGVSTDTVEATVKAILNAVNRIVLTTRGSGDIR